MIDTHEIETKLNLPLRLINDFEAAAFSLSALGQQDIVQIGAGAAVPFAPRAVLGPGSGLGLACLISHDGKELVVSSEGGHATLPATCEREEAVVRHLRQRFGHASFERAISGPGLENIYQAISSIDCSQATAPTAAAITQAALARTCARSIEALDLFLQVSRLVCRQCRAHVPGAGRSLYRGWHFAPNFKVSRGLGVSQMLRGKGPFQRIPEGHSNIRNYSPRRCFRRLEQASRVIDTRASALDKGCRSSANHRAAKKQDRQKDRFN